VCLQFAQAFPKLGGTSANRANSFAFSLHKLSRAKARLYYHVAIMTQRLFYVFYFVFIVIWRIFVAIVNKCH
ncbi:MAG: hypothetical protein IJK41_10855, partial [Muribaculaceae bacterium]|nr:hypothetical protein [Muribaculaceae bacterium]